MIDDADRKCTLEATHEIEENRQFFCLLLDTDARSLSNGGLFLWMIIFHPDLLPIGESFLFPDRNLSF